MDHLAPKFTETQITTDPILRYFEYAHLPEHLQATSRVFAALALHIVTTVQRNPERTVALRKLLEAKDAAVRANLPEPVRAFEKDGTEISPVTGEPIEIRNADIGVDGPPSFR